ncbi:unnamed protein product [Pleuronectes platessa]|uniref:Small ribosomal subunit protein uS14 n=1 Tax=Pleuronectes platessa TaxID=8262 RepID=A0A9N7ULZ4_PLEPL|nr:unnamed protein product [Pleuronectes platessa]
MGHQQLYWSHPRKFGQGSRSCRVCSNRHGLIRKYGLNMCRQCFRQYAKDIGFVKETLRNRFTPAGAALHRRGRERARRQEQWKVMRREASLGRSSSVPVGREMREMQNVLRRFFANRHAPPQLGLALSPLTPQRDE